MSEADAVLRLEESLRKLLVVGNIRWARHISKQSLNYLFDSMN